MNRIDQDKAQQAVDDYIATHFDPRASELWAIIEQHATPSDQEPPHHDAPPHRTHPH